MELIEQLEFLFGSVGVILSIFFCVILFSKKKNSNLFLIIFLITYGLRIGKSLFHNFYELSPSFRTYMLNIMFCIGPSIWLFSKYLLSETEELDKRDWLHYLFFFIMLPICWFIPNNGGGSPYFALFYNATIFHIFGYLVFAIYYFTAGKGKELRLQKGKVGDWCFKFLWANLFVIIWYFLISESVIPYYIGISFLYTIMVLVFGIWALKLPSIFSQSKKRYGDSGLTKKKAEQIFQLVEDLLKEEKLFLDPALTLGKLSQRISVSSKDLSQSINQIVGMNYSQYISRYRVEEAMRLLRSSEYDHYKIAAIAYESGFNSISSFNKLFKDHTQSTAKAYRNNHNSPFI